MPKAPRGTRVPAVPAGYSRTPLVQKLGIKPGDSIATINEPDDFRDLLVDLPSGTTFQSDLAGEPDVSIGFFTSKTDLEAELGALANAAFPNRIIWLAWPKKASRVQTDLTGDVVRAAILATQLVDVKVCAISDTWSGLKAVWRKEHR